MPREKESKIAVEIPKKNCTVTILWENKKQVLQIRKGLGFQALCLRHKSPLEFDCRKSNCGICIFKVLEGSKNLSKVEEKEQKFLTAMRAEDDERLACQCRILGDVDIHVEY